MTWGVCPFLHWFAPLESDEATERVPDAVDRLKAELAALPLVYTSSQNMNLVPLVRTILDTPVLFEKAKIELAGFSTFADTEMLVQRTAEDPNKVMLIYMLHRAVHTHETE